MDGSKEERLVLDVVNSAAFGESLIDQKMQWQVNLHNFNFRLLKQSIYWRKRGKVMNAGTTKFLLCAYTETTYQILQPT